MNTRDRQLERALDLDPETLQALRSLRYLRRAWHVLLGTRRRVSRILLERAEVELLHVHRLEQARLLAQAAEIALGMQALGRGLGCLRWSAPELRVWRARAREETRWAGVDGLPAPRLLERCLAERTSGWPRASTLARCSLRLDPCEETRRRLVLALTVEGRIPEARAEAQRALPPVPHFEICE
jgi:hypothetical protein